MEDTIHGVNSGRNDGLKSPRKRADSHTVVFIGKERLCCQPDEDKWYQLPDAPPGGTSDFK